MNYLSTDYHTFLVAFKTTTTKYICNDSKDVLQCIQDQDKHNGLKYIKTFDKSKEKFVKANKETLKQLLINDAESTQFFTNHYYFKS